MGPAPGACAGERKHYFFKVQRGKVLEKPALRMATIPKQEEKQRMKWTVEGERNVDRGQWKWEQRHMESRAKQT